MTKEKWLAAQRESLSARDFALVDEALRVLEENTLCDERYPWGGARVISPWRGRSAGIWNWDSVFHAMTVARFSFHSEHTPPYVNKKAPQKRCFFVFARSSFGGLRFKSLLPRGRSALPMPARRIRSGRTQRIAFARMFFEYGHAAFIAARAISKKPKRARRWPSASVSGCVCRQAKARQADASVHLVSLSVTRTSFFSVYGAKLCSFVRLRVVDIPCL